METYLRYSGDSKSLRIHAKEKFPIDSLTFLQVHGEIDMRSGGPTYYNNNSQSATRSRETWGGPNYCAAILRHFYPDLSASLSLGVQFDRHEKLRYTVRAKKAFPVSSNGMLSFNIKGRCDADKDFNKRTSKGAAEFVWSIFNFQKDQDVRLKLGYDVIDKLAYMQIRENNWTLNADGKGRWNVRYDL